MASMDIGVPDRLHSSNSLARLQEASVDDLPLNPPYMSSSSHVSIHGSMCRRRTRAQTRYTWEVMARIRKPYGSPSSASPFPRKQDRDMVNWAGQSHPSSTNLRTTVIHLAARRVICFKSEAAQ
eukprot:15476398-Alexandrium_andersonii.AAC.1